MGFQNVWQKFYGCQTFPQKWFQLKLTPKGRQFDAESPGTLRNTEKTIFSLAEGPGWVVGSYVMTKPISATVADMGLVIT